MNLAALWNYMQFDLEQEKFSQEMRQSPKRKQLLSQSEQLKGFQASNAKIDSEIEGIEARIAEINPEYERLSSMAEEYVTSIGDIEKLTAEELEEKMKPVEKLVSTIESYEKELSKLSKDCQSAEKRQNDLKIRAAKLKQQYDALKAEYDVEFVADKKKLGQLKKKADDEAAKLDTADLEKYKAVRQQATPPIAKLINNQCTGCFMALPIGTLREINSGVIKTCDNCGRILYLVEE